MRLPPWLWKVFRSKRFHRILIIAPITFIVGVVIYYAVMNHQGRVEWEATRAWLHTLESPQSHVSREDSPEFPGTDSLTSNELELDFILMKMGMEVVGASGRFFPDDQNKLTPISAYFPASRSTEPEQVLANEFLEKLEPTERDLQPMIDALREAEVPIPVAWGENQSPFLIDKALTFLLFRASLQMAKGDLDATFKDLELVSRSTDRWQNRPGGLLHAVINYGQITRIICFSRSLLDTDQLTQPQLQSLETRLGELDEFGPLIRSIEVDQMWMFDGANRPPPYPSRHRV